MKETNTQQLYTSPEVKVVEIKARKVLCGSPCSTTSMGFETDNGTNWE